MTADQAFQSLLNEIPEKDQRTLLSQHGITDLPKLLDKKLQLQERKLDGVCSDVQMVLEVVCTYLESLDSASSFSWEGLENFCDYTDNSGDYILDTAEETRTKKADQSDEDTDPDGLNLTAEERKQMEQNIEDDPLTMKIRGFSARALQFEVDENNNKKLVNDCSEKTQVAFNGSVFYVKKCYYYQQENGEIVVVGIRKFTKVS